MTDDFDNDTLRNVNTAACPCLATARGNSSPRRRSINTHTVNHCTPAMCNASGSRVHPCILLSPGDYIYGLQCHYNLIALVENFDK